MKRLFLIDIDGVLADCEHRLHHQQNKDYDQFYSADEMLDDEVIGSGVTLLSVFRYDNLDTDTVYLTGRPERTRRYTEAWFGLKDIYPAPGNYTRMLMRADGDYRPSSIVKLEALDKFLFDAYLERNWKMTKREVNKFNKLSVEEKRVIVSEYYDEITYIDDDPTNIKEIVDAYPKTTGLVFGTKRIAC